MANETRALSGKFVSLEPLEMEHVDGLWAAGADPELWRWTTVKIRSRADMERYVAQAIAERDRGISVPFATIHRATGEIAGTTRFGNIVLEHKRVEIGWTFVAPRWQRTGVNTEAKYLMLRHAFETWGCNRVEMKTSALNVQSQDAMERLGAKREGTLRRHMINEDGTVRDTVYFSIIAEEWPDVKTRLEGRLMR